MLTSVEPAPAGAVVRRRPAGCEPFITRIWSPAPEPRAQLGQSAEAGQSSFSLPLDEQSSTNQVCSANPHVYKLPGAAIAEMQC